MKKLAIVFGLLAVIPSAQAHRLWLLPAATVLSGDTPWVTVDAAVSNDIFFFNHHPLKSAQITVLAPDGQPIPLQNAMDGKHRSVFDLELKQPGTYKIQLARKGLRAQWENDAGERQFWPGRGETPPPGAFAKQVPQQAKNLEVSDSAMRVETFITVGAPTRSQLKPTGVGLEMKPITHPNDLFAGEAAEFQFLMDGEPAAATEITVIAGGTRYRDDPETLTFTADATGKVTIRWPHAAMYWLEASYADDRAKPPASTRTGTYITTLEVLPL